MKGSDGVYLHNICIKYDKSTVILSLSLQIPKGNISVVLGPSGSGKTTLLKGIAGLKPLDSGSIQWDKKNEKLGVVFQEPRLFPHMTVLQNLTFGLRAQGVSRRERQEAGRYMISILKLDGLENRYPHQLSGGQKQRISLGRTLILEPDLLLLDEPFSSLDMVLRNELIQWLYDFQKKNRFTVLWVTHSLEEAFMVADYIGVMIQGEMLQYGPAMEISRHPASEEVARFLSLPNRFSKEKWFNWFPDYFGVHPNSMGWLPSEYLDIVVGEGDRNDGPYDRRTNDLQKKWLRGTVDRVKPERNGITLYVNVENEKWEVFQASTISTPSVGTRVSLGIKVSDIIWYPKSREVK